MSVSGRRSTTSTIREQLAPRLPRESPTQRQPHDLICQPQWVALEPPPVPRCETVCAHPVSLAASVTSQPSKTRRWPPCVPLWASLRKPRNWVCAGPQNQPRPSRHFFARFLEQPRRSILVQPAKELSSIKMQRGMNISAKEKGATKQAYQDRQSQILRKLPLCRSLDRLIDLVISQHSEDHCGHLPGHMADDAHISHTFCGLLFVISAEHRVALYRVSTGHPDGPSQVG